MASGRVDTYAQFHDRISRLANALTTRLDTRPGDRILVLSRNDSDVFEIQFACQRSATIFVPLNWRLAVGELRLIVRDAAAPVLFHGSEFREVAQLGVVNRQFPAPDLRKETMAFANTLEKVCDACRRDDKALGPGANAALAAGLAVDRRNIATLFHSDDAKEGFSAFTERRKPNFSGR